MTEEIKICYRTGDHSKYGFTNIGDSSSSFWVCAKPGCLLPTRLYREAVCAQESASQGEELL